MELLNGFESLASSLPELPRDGLPLCHTLQTLTGQYNQCHPNAPLPMISFHDLREIERQAADSLDQMLGRKG